MPETEGIFGFTKEKASLIWSQLCPQASEEELRYFLMQAQHRNLDPLNGQIKLSIRRSFDKETKRWDSRAVIITGIDGFRAIAGRTGQYEGQIGPLFCGANKQWTEVWLDTKPPMAAKVGTWRTGFREPIWSVALWSEYCQTSKSGEPQALWAKMPDLMLGKVAEALCLRRAFPEELGGLYTEDEMAQADNEPAPIRQFPPPKQAREEPDNEAEDNPPTSAESLEAQANPETGELPNTVSPLDDDTAYSNLLTLMVGGGKTMGGAPGLPPRFCTHYLDIWKSQPAIYPDKAKLFAAARTLARTVQKLLVFDLNEALERSAIGRDEAKSLLGVTHMTDLLGADGTMPTIDEIKSKIAAAIEAAAKEE